MDDIAEQIYVFSATAPAPASRCCSDRARSWRRVSEALSRVLWGLVCCGVPGAPCYYCACACSTPSRGSQLLEPRPRPRPPQRVHLPPINLAELMVESHRPSSSRQASRRPHTPRAHAHCPHLISAVRTALDELQGQPAEKGAPPVPVPGVITSQPTKLCEQHPDARELACPLHPA